MFQVFFKQSRAVPADGKWVKKLTEQHRRFEAKYKDSNELAQSFLPARKPKKQ
jgi:hypothetical protein